MTREQAIDNLGTIAKSGSQDFKTMFDNSDAEMEQAAESIIG